VELEEIMRAQFNLLMGGAVTCALLSGCGHPDIKRTATDRAGSGAQPMSTFDTFPEFIDLVERAGSPEAKGEIVQRFEEWAEAKGYPIVEGDRAHFVYIAPRVRRVTVPSDFNSWDIQSDAMKNLSGTDLWYVTKTFPKDARLDYKFHVNGQWMMDPQNPRTMLGGFGPNSELRMPGYESPPEIEFYPEIAHGIIDTVDFEDPVTSRIRTIEIYLPPGYGTGDEAFPTLYVQDGSEYISLAQIHNVADYLIHHGKIRPLILVCIPPLNRGQEYGMSDAYRTYLVERVVPWVDSQYSTITAPEARGIMGASLGGLISSYVATRHPDVFGHCAGQSTYFGDIGDRMIRMLDEEPKKPIRWYLDVGTYEVGVGRSDLYGQNRHVRDLLRAKGYDLFYREYPEGHSWGNWKAHLDDILIYFWPENP
jgi:enterochelin esterase family protein